MEAMGPPLWHELLWATGMRHATWASQSPYLLIHRHVALDHHELPDALQVCSALPSTSSFNTICAFCETVRQQV